jgi:hypothetical protein
MVLFVMLVIALRIRARSRSRVETSTPVALPSGAEAAIWSILEAVPDPRNHLALTRDLTGEVRITGTPLDPAFRGEAGESDPWSAAAARRESAERLRLTA